MEDDVLRNPENSGILLPDNLAAPQGVVIISVHFKKFCLLLVAAPSFVANV